MSNFLKPYVCTQCGGKVNRATLVWASEIEEFCIAVTKRRFGEKGADDGVHQ